MVEIEQSASLDPSLWMNSTTTVRDEREQVFRISSWLDFPFTVDEVAEYFLPGLNLTGDQVKALFTERAIDLPFTLRDRYLLTDISQSIIEMKRSRNLRSFSSLVESLSRYDACHIFDFPCLKLSLSSTWPWPYLWWCSRQLWHCPLAILLGLHMLRQVPHNIP